MQSSDEGERARIKNGRACIVTGSGGRRRGRGRCPAPPRWADPHGLKKGGVRTVKALGRASTEALAGVVLLQPRRVLQRERERAE